MMRAALILVGVGLLVAMEIGTPPRVAKAVDQPLTQSTVGAGDPRDTLAKADRLEIPYFQKQLSTRLISFAEPMPPVRHEGPSSNTGTSVPAIRQTPP